MLTEDLLAAWLRLTTVIDNQRLAVPCAADQPRLPFNEAMVCGLLVRAQEQGHCLTASDLCRQTRILKSQMNRTLQSMEDKGLIERTRSTLDKRQVFLWLNTDSPAFRTQHEKSLKLIDSLIARTGEEKAGKIAQLFAEIATLAQETIQ